MGSNSPLATTQLSERFFPDVTKGNFDFQAVQDSHVFRWKQASFAVREQGTKDVAEFLTKEMKLEQLDYSHLLLL